MNSDFMMSVQGSSIGAFNRAPRPLRTLALTAAAVAVFGAVVASPRMHSSAYSHHAVCRSSARAMYSIISLCRMGRSKDAVRVADYQLAHLGCNSLASGELHFLRAGALRLQGREDEARADYAIASSITGSRLDPELQLDYHAQSGDVQTSDRMATDILNDRTSDLVAINNASWQITMHRGGNAAYAANVMEPIVRSSDNWGYIDTYAWSLYMSGRRQEAIQQELRAVRLVNSSNPEDAAYCSACLQGFQGDPIGAMATLRSVFQDNITNTSAWDARSCFADAPANRISFACHSGQDKP